MPFQLLLKGHLCIVHYVIAVNIGPLSVQVSTNTYN